MERSYIQQVESRLKQQSTDYLWKKINRFDNLDRIMSELRPLKPVSPEAVKRSLPNGLGVKAVIQEGGFLFKKTALTLEVGVVSDYRELHLRGFDTQISYGELWWHVEDATRVAKGCPYVLALASPAGWDAEAIDYVREGKSLAHGLSLALIGLKDRVIHYNGVDERMKKVLPYLEVK